MQAVILAAGMWKRLKNLTRDNAKCMVKVCGETIIERLLHQIEVRWFERIIIVIWYKGNKLKNFISSLKIKIPIIYVENPIYDQTNNIYSLSLAKKYLKKDDSILFESDLVLEDAIIDRLIKDPRETLAVVDNYREWMSGTCFKLSNNDTILEIVSSKKLKLKDFKKYYKTVNVYKFSKIFSAKKYIPFMEAYIKAVWVNEYYENVLNSIILLNNPEIVCLRLTWELWYEIDNLSDLLQAENIFSSNK